MEGESKQSIEKKKLLNSNYIIININTSNTLKMFIVSWSNALHIREQFKLIHNPDMKTSAKHFRVYAPQAHDTQTKLKVFRSSVLALNKIDNLDIPFNSPELLIFSKVTARHYLVFKNLIQPCFLTSVAEMKGTFNCFTTLLPQSVTEMFQRKSLWWRKYQERLKRYIIERRSSTARWENESGEVPWPISLCRLEAGSASAEIESLYVNKQNVFIYMKI